MEGSESPIQIPGTKHIWVYIQVRDCTVYMLNCTICNENLLNYHDLKKNHQLKNTLTIPAGGGGVNLTPL